jgi:hypothetical protein
MAWARIDDSMMLHPKIVAAGPIAELIQYRALQYCNRFLTDGFVPAGAVPSLLTGLEAFTLGRDWPAEMVRTRLWSVRRGGYLVHDFLDYNRSKADVIAERDRKRKGGIKGAKRTNSRRWRSGYAARSPATDDDGNSVAPIPSPKNKKEPVATDGGIAQGAPAVPAGRQNGFHVARASDSAESPAPVGDHDRRSPTPTARDPRAPARGTFEAIRDRVTAEHPRLTGDALARLVLSEFQRVLPIGQNLSA